MGERGSQQQNERRAHKISEDMCANYYTASLKCLEKNGYDKSKCQQAFDEYVDCKKRESESRLQRRIEKQQQSRR